MFPKKEPKTAFLTGILTTNKPGNVMTVRIKVALMVAAKPPGSPRANSLAA
jgi:hypothetical protein